MNQLLIFIKIIFNRIIAPILVFGVVFSVFISLVWVVGFVSIKIGIPAAKGSFVEHPNLGTGLAVMSLCLLVFLIAFLAYSTAKALYKTVANAWNESKK